MPAATTVIEKYGSSYMLTALVWTGLATLLLIVQLLNFKPLGPEVLSYSIAYFGFIALQFISGVSMLLGWRRARIGSGVFALVVIAVVAISLAPAFRPGVVSGDWVQLAAIAGFLVEGATAASVFAQLIRAGRIDRALARQSKESRQEPLSSDHVPMLGRNDS
ncbi:MAG: hypothetical protein JSS65_08760 [Armatimonadetes bacterium]|nr:hypothetical protein [Armatimonadota bacterium]